jgi:tRNA uridine 5-carbamoylmethylation protein Kti12
MKEKYQLSLSIHNDLYNTIVKDQLDKTTRVESPIIVILGGQPGSGKSKIFDYAKNQIFNNDNVLSINGDDYRMLHPDTDNIFTLYDKKYAEFTDLDGRLWTSRLLEECVKSRRNIIF